MRTVKKFSGFYTPLTQEELKELKVGDFILLKVQVLDNTLEADKTLNNVYAIYSE